VLLVISSKVVTHDFCKTRLGDANDVSPVSIRPVSE